MSIRENLHYEMYLAGDVTPEWIKGRDTSIVMIFMDPLRRRAKQI